MSFSLAAFSADLASAGLPIHPCISALRSCRGCCPSHQGTASCTSCCYLRQSCRPNPSVLSVGCLQWDQPGQECGQKIAHQTRPRKQAVGGMGCGGSTAHQETVSVLYGSGCKRMSCNAPEHVTPLRQPQHQATPLQCPQCSHHQPIFPSQAVRAWQWAVVHRSCCSWGASAPVALADGLPFSCLVQPHSQVMIASNRRRPSGAWQAPSLAENVALPRAAGMPRGGPWL